MLGRRVVVTGLGAVAPNGVGLPAFRQALKAGRSGIRALEELRELNFACQIGGIPPLAEEQVLELLPYSFYDKLNEAMVYAALAALECARSAGLEVDLERDLREGATDYSCGAVIGAGMGGLDTVLDELVPVLEEAPDAAPGRGLLPLGADGVPKVMGSGVSVTVGRLLGLGAQVTSNSSACCTGTEALFEGWKHLQLGLADAMYVGGVESSSVGVWAGFDAMRNVLCSTYNELPERGSQPMGAGACGFVPGSGAGVLRLETLEAARARGAPILAEVLAAFSNSGGQRQGGSMTFPNREGVVRCVRRTLELGRVDPADVTLINGHLTSTGADPLEVSEWLEALKVPPQRFPPIQSTKSMIGHALGAAGALELVALVDQLAEGYIHPSINCERVHPEIAPIEASIARELRLGVEHRVALKSSFGFGDVNACVALRRWDGE
ncbi:MAG: beta-ketoacyl synthase [Planctomycetota bacterium]